MDDSDEESFEGFDDDDDEENCGSSDYVFRPFVITKISYKGIAPHRYPSPRSGHRTVCTESNLYCLGGFDPLSGRRSATATGLFKELWRFNFVTRRWTLQINSKSREMPEELASNAVVVHKNALLAFGGTGYPFGQTCSNQCYVYSSERPIVTRLHVTGDLPTPQYGPAIVVHNNYLYTVGGTTGSEYFCDVYRLDLSTKRWESVYISRPDMRDDPEGRYRHEIVYNGKFIFILGGGTSDAAFNLKSVPAFDLEYNRWNYINTKPDVTIRTGGGYPEPRKCYSCIQYNTSNGIEAIIVGGIGDTEMYFADIWKLNFNNLTWTLIRTAQLPNPLYFHSASTPGNGCMYVFGGIEIDQDLSRTNDLFKIWTIIPKLSEMCWEAITYYNPNIDSHSKAELRRVGVPQKFVNRVPDCTQKSATSSKSWTSSYYSLSKRIRSLSQ